MSDIVKVVKAAEKKGKKGEPTVAQTLTAGVVLSSVDLMAHLLHSGRYISLQKDTGWN